MSKLRVVVCAAVRHRDSLRIITGVRHYDQLMRFQMQESEGIEYWKGCEQGFVDNFGIFMTREEAKMLAELRSQIIERVGGDDKKLFSENLY